MAEKKEERSWKWVTVGIFILLLILVVGTLYQVWLMVTEQIDVGGSCVISHIDYVAIEGEGKCMLPLVAGEDVSVCGLPADIKCDVGMSNVPVIRFLAEMAR